MFRNEIILTDFLDPGQIAMLKAIAGTEIYVQEYGGYNRAEKRRLYLTPKKSKRSIFDFQIAICQINYPSKFAQLNHSMILGTLANAGVETDTFGDIITDGNGNWQFMVKKELLPFFEKEINRIGQTKVEIKSVKLSQVLLPKDNSKEVVIITSSLRIDAVLSGISGHSRRQMKDAFANNLIKLNWHYVIDSNIIVKKDDILSLRFFGRSQILDILITRKGKYKVVLKLWQTKKHRRN
ncbi:RNA-binding protein [Lactobacillus sp. ESL0246]|uniref:YlmH family RNA-binding protein n=1 Tax=Lactobacillus sp. ESL0246 TaxID=2069359 RepID=UPI001F305B76|nr:YlmH/Sll1252 family protein [Lactobacillus sp. ESL0246]